jgi:hypothetical protein
MTTINTCYSDYTKIIDVAALGHVLNPIELKEEAHIIELDDIPISSLLFRRIFYAYDGDSFNLDCQLCRTDQFKDLKKFISFRPEDRTINSVKFNLLNTIFGHIEEDLEVPRDCFDLTCRMELEKELACIDSICDVNSCSVLTALKWHEVLKLLLSQGALPSGKDNNGNIIYHVLKVSVIFKNPNRDVKDTIIKFRYLIGDIDFNEIN